MKHIVNLSGGKDSTAMLLLMLEQQMPIDYIIFCDTGKDFPQMIKHLNLLASYLMSNFPNAPRITTIRLEVDNSITVATGQIIKQSNSKTYDHFMFEHIKTKGKNKGKKGYGWATMLCRWCTSKLKTDTIARFCKQLGDDVIHYVGIAYDEPNRIKYKPNYRYPLFEQHITEKQALQYCYDGGFDWDGLYEHFDRLSCWCCPLKNLKELKVLWKFYPELWAELKEMDDKSYNKFRADYSILELEQKFIMEEK